VHISELAQQHVENPREIVQPGDEVRVKILEIDSERRRLSLSVKRVEGQVLPRREGFEPVEGEGGEVAEGAGDLDDVPELGLSEDVFAQAEAEAAGQPDAAEALAEPDEAPAAEPAEADEAPAGEPVEAPADQPS